MKTIFITVSESPVANNLLRGSFFSILKKEDLRLVLIAPPAKVAGYREEFGAANVFIEPLSPPPHPFLERVTTFFARNVLRTGMVKLVQVRQHADKPNAFLLFTKMFLRTLLGRSRMLQNVVRLVEHIIPSHASVKEFFDQYSPELVFATVMNYTEMDVPILREAKRRGVKTIGIMRGWDTFVTHGFLRIIPDKVLLQNQYLQEAGKEYQFLPEEITEIVGLPHFDWYFKKEWIVPREEFCRTVGIDPKKRIILFGAMEYYWYERDYEIAEVFDELVRNGKLPADLVMLFRPYPGFAGPVEKIKGLRYVVPDMEAFTLAQGDNVEMKQKQVAHLLNSLVHSTTVVSVVSTIAIDGVALGKPAVSAAFEKEKVPYWRSIKRFFTHCTHFMEVFKTDGIRVVNSPEEFTEALNAYLKNLEKDSAGRKELMRKFVEPFDGKTGERIARAVLDQIR